MTILLRCHASLDELRGLQTSAIEDAATTQSPHLAVASDERPLLRYAFFPGLKRPFGSHARVTAR